MMNKSRFILILLIATMLLSSASAAVLTEDWESATIEELEEARTLIDNQIETLRAGAESVDATNEASEPLTEGKYKYVILKDDTAKIIEYTGITRDLAIPETIGDHPVSVIGELAFQGNEYIKALNIPGCIKQIEANAFSHCTRLSDVVLSNGLIYIGNNAFSFCEKLGYIVIPDSVETICDEAFQNCGLYYVDLGKNVKEIGNMAFDSNPFSNIALPDSIELMGANPFSDCQNLTTITASPTHSYLAIIGSSLFSKPDKRLICCPSGQYSCDIPDGIQVIGAYSFYNNEHYLDIILPETVTTIEEEAFSECAIGKLIIPKSVSNIGANPFRGLYMHRVSISDDNPNFCLMEINYNTFVYDKINKRMITNCGAQAYPEDTREIGDKAYYLDISMKQFNVPNGITVIGNEAFGLCISLEKVKIPESVTSIGKDTFKSCSKLQCIVIPGSYAENYCIENNIPYNYENNTDWLNP